MPLYPGSRISIKANDHPPPITSHICSTASSLHACCYAPAMLTHLPPPPTPPPKKTSNVTHSCY